MAYDQYLEERISQIMYKKKVPYVTKKMMGGLIFMVDDKMCCGIHIDKKSGDSLLMARIGEEAYHKVIDKEVCLPMNFTKRPMKGYIYITPLGFDNDTDLENWIQLALDFNHLNFK